MTTLCFHRRMELENFDGALEALIESGAENYGDGESMEKLHQLSSRFDSFMTEAIAAFEKSEEWAADGAKTASAWIATRCRVSRVATRRRVRLGRTLRHLPEVAQAWREGEIGGDQAQAIAHARRRRTEAAMARDEEVLVSQAKELGFEDFSRSWPIGSSWPTPTGPKTQKRRRRPLVMSS